MGESLIFDLLGKEDINLGYGTFSSVVPDGTTQTFNKVGIHTLLGTRTLNAADQTGATSGDKINAAVTALAGARGVVIAPATMAAGEGSQLPDNAILIDCRGTAASQGIRFNISAAVGTVRQKVLIQDNFSASTVGLSPGAASATFYTVGYVDAPQVTNNTLAAINGTMIINTQGGTFNGVLVGIEGEAFANSTNASPYICVDVRGGTFNSYCGGNTVVNNIRSLVAQAPVNLNPGTSVIHNAVGLLVEGFTGVGDTTNWPFWCTGLAVIDGVVSLGGDAPSSSVGLQERHYSLTGTNQFGIQAAPVATSAATATGIGVVGRCDTAAAAFTQGINAGLYAQNPTKGAGSAITLGVGLYIEDQTRATTNYGVYSLHTGDSLFTGPVEMKYAKISGATPTTGISGGRIAFGTTTSSTIGANGAASALTPLPLGYLKFNLNGAMVQFPYYNV